MPSVAIACKKWAIQISSAKQNTVDLNRKQSTMMWKDQAPRFFSQLSDEIPRSGEVEDKTHRAFGVVVWLYYARWSYWNMDYNC
jgi:hypothetical protein